MGLLQPFVKTDQFGKSSSYQGCIVLMLEHATTFLP